MKRDGVILLLLVLFFTAIYELKGLPLDAIPDTYTLQLYVNCGQDADTPNLLESGIYTFAGGMIDSREEARTVAHHPVAVEAIFDLNPEVPWVLSVTYASDGERVQSLLANGEVLQQGYRLPVGRSEQYIYALPDHMTKGGKLHLEFLREVGPNAVVSEIQLWAPLPQKPFPRLHVTQEGLQGDLVGTFSDVLHGPIENAEINAYLNTSVDPVWTDRTDANGRFRFELGAMELRNESVRVIAGEGDARIEKVIELSDLSFAIPVYRPIPMTVTGLNETEKILDGLWELYLPTNADTHDVKPFRVPGQLLQQGFQLDRESSVVLQHGFRVPDSWQGNNIILRFDAVYGAASYWLNDIELGDSDLAFLPVEYDITDAVLWGEEQLLRLTLRPESVSDMLAHGSAYAHHELAGIHRSVRVFAVPTTHIEQLQLSTRFDANYVHANLDITLGLHKGSQDDVYSIQCCLRDATGKIIPMQNDKIVLSDVIKENGLYMLSFPVSAPEHWTAESPYLYELELTLLTGDTELQTVQRQVGFREVRVEEGKLLVNGVPVILAGVNRHEFDPLTGRADTMRHGEIDARLFKGANINYIRTSHYPPTREFLEACDRIGLYVQVEAPFCWTRNHTEYEESPKHFVHIIEPTAAMLAYHGSHPSVIMWSLANESGHGERLPGNYVRSLEYVHRTDTTRPVCFNNEFAHDSGLGDIAILHYQDPPFVNAPHVLEQGRPILLDEFWHVPVYQPTEMALDPARSEEWGMGFNREDSLWNQLLEFPTFLGGAIWAGIDEVFQFDDGIETGYGPWGLVDRWRREKPEWWIAKRVYSPVWIPLNEIPDVRPGDELSIPIENRYSFTNLSALKIDWKLYPHRKHESLSCVDNGTIHYELAPRSSGQLNMLLPDIQFQGHQLVLEFYRDNELVTAHAITLGKAIEDTPIILSGSPQWFEDDQHIQIQGERYAFRIDRTTLQLEPEPGGSQFPILRLPEFHATRKEEGFAGIISSPFEEYPDKESRVIESIAVYELDAALQIDVREQFNDFAGTISWMLDSAGYSKISFAYTYTGNVVPGREVGVRLTLPEQFNQLQWVRDSEWGIYPPDHIGRSFGHANTFRVGSGPDEIFNQRPDWLWYLDANAMGTRDFRSTRHNIRDVWLTADKNQALHILGRGKCNVRAQVSGGNVYLHVLNVGAPNLSPGSQFSNSFEILFVLE